MKKKARIKAKSKTNQPVAKIENLKPARDRSFSLWLFGVLAFTGLCLIPMLNNGFTNWDDDPYSGVGLPSGGSRPVEDGGGGEKLYIQTRSKMSDMKDDEDPF